MYSVCEIFEVLTGRLRVEDQPCIRLRICQLSAYQELVKRTKERMFGRRCKERGEFVAQLNVSHGKVASDQADFSNRLR